MTDAMDKFQGAQRRLAEMQARMAAYMPRPKVESGITRGEKHSGRIRPQDLERPRTKRVKD